MTKTTQFKKPFFIFIEGADGVGKTTTTSRLFIELKEKGFKVIQESIMQCTEVGNMLRSISIHEDISEHLRFMAYSFGVFYGLKKMSQNNIESDFIIVDRSHASTYAQTICSGNIDEADKLSMKFIFSKMVKQFNEDHIGSHLFVDLVADPLKALDRISATRGSLDLLESRGVEYQRNIAIGYNSFFKEYGHDKNLIMIDTDQHTPDEVVTLVALKLNELEKI